MPFLLTSCGADRSGTLSKEEPFIADLDAIREKGKLVAVVDYNSTNYFIYRGEPMGYQFDMLKVFANHLGIDLEIMVENDLEKSFDLLNSGSCDLIALNLTVTQKRKQIVTFSIPISQTRQVLVQKKPEDWRIIPIHEFEKRMIRNQLDLAGKTIYVQKNSSFSQRLYNLVEEIGDTIYIIEVKEEAEQFGINRNSTPLENIEAGVKFIQWLGEVFEDKVSDEDEKTKFILGAYNVGLGHILDARRLARKHNQDPDNWDIVAEKLILKSNPEYYHDPVVRYGYCRGDEPVNYVREILDRYEHYKNIINNDLVISER